MYERSAIVLERYMERILKFNKNYNLKKNNENYKELINEIENYQKVTEKELEIIQEFDDTAKEIENLQQEQEKLYKANQKLEDERAQLFTELGEEAEVLEIKLKKIETLLEKNNEKLKEIRVEFVKYLTDFSKKQKNRNKCEKARRIGEANHIGYIKKMNTEFDELDVKDVVCLKDFINFEKEPIKQEVLDIMIKNGKSERVAFNEEVLKRAIKVRIDIAEKEADCYILVYDKMKKLLAEQDSEAIRLNKYKKVLRDTSVKLAFLNAEREYIVGFLDYERMTAISGTNVHKKMMIEACHNFELDIMQIEKLYELILRETTNRSTKKGYNQLYNKTYLKNIEDKEKNFEQEVNNVNISMGTVINSNYWRIEGIKNIYNVFQEEVSQNFNRDLSEYKMEEAEAEEEMQETKETKKLEKIASYAKDKKEEQEEHYKQFKYDEHGEYDEYDYDDMEEEEVEINQYDEDADDYEEYQYKIDDYNFKKEDNDDYEEEDYEDEYEEEVIYEDNYEEDEEEDNYNSYDEKTSYRYKKDNYLKEDDTEEEKEDFYEDDDYEEEDYEEYNNEEEPYEQDNDEEENYKEEEDEEKYDKDDEQDEYKAYHNETYQYNKKPYVEEEDEDEYENVYEYNYDDDEEEYRKQKLKNKTVISFDDEESIDMIIANSRKKSNSRRNNNKGIFNKFFKK